jgi:hypothetical protein
VPQMRRGSADPHRGLRPVHQLRLFEMLVGVRGQTALDFT